MKKLIAIVITLIFIFDGTGHCLATDALRPQLLCQKGAGVKKTTASNQFRIGKVEVINPEALKAINIKHAVFDYDGTIDVSLEGLWQETEASFMLLTRETANSIVNKTLGMHTFERMKIAVKEAHPRWDDYRVSIIARLLENQAKEEMYVKWRAAYWTKDTALVPGVTGVLEAFSKTGIICHVATADYVKNKIKMADRFGILEYFGKNGERIHGDGDERYEGKEEFLRSLITGEIKANQIVMFGDSLSDIKAAKSAGCIAIGIAKDNKLREEFIEAGTDIVIHGNCRNIREILAVLKVKQYTQADLEKIERVEIAIRSMEHGDRLLDVVSGLIGIDINLAVLEKLIYKTGRSNKNLQEKLQQVHSNVKNNIRNIKEITDEVKFYSLIDINMRDEYLKKLENLYNQANAYIRIIGQIKRTINQNGVNEECASINTSLGAIIEKLESRIRFAYGRKSNNKNDAEALVKEALGFLDIEAKKCVTIEDHLDKSLNIQENRLSLLSALNNIVNNAIYFAREFSKEKAKVAIALEQKRSFIEIRIKDNGPGIPPELLKINPKTKRPYLFDLNFSTKGNKGTGLGTTETWYAIRDAGGSIRVRSKLGKGTTFIIRLPISDIENFEVVKASL